MRGLSAHGVCLMENYLHKQETIRLKTGVLVVVRDVFPLKSRLFAWVKVFRINPEFMILSLTFHRKSASKC